jgi:hypothetical protein
MKTLLWTIRWYLNNWTDDSRQALLRLVNRALGIVEPVEVEGITEKVMDAETGEVTLRVRPNARELYYPDARTDFPKSRTRGSYPKGGPEGALVHWTAGRPEQTLDAAMAYQAKRGFTYFCIDADGNVGQNFPLNRHGYHGGKSYWPKFGNYVSNRIVGIEVLNPGVVDKSNAPWFDDDLHYDESLIRVVTKKVDNMAAGRYYKYTEAQEKSLVRLLLWLDRNFAEFDLDYVLGHDEVSPGRKVDPGGSLSMSMPRFREFLKKKKAQLK